MTDEQIAFLRKAEKGIDVFADDFDDDLADFLEEKGLARFGRTLDDTTFRITESGKAFLREMDDVQEKRRKAVAEKEAQEKRMAAEKRIDRRHRLGDVILGTAVGTVFGALATLAFQHAAEIFSAVSHFFRSLLS